ncbi:MarR family winged helix-turn-helix transcriptional regulator [Conexibacter woesei]|uniref:Transcriptional regulator, TrmB n=1 Tax=Conexibacter woesei (strain DSM 14684 / CCUG 47730 / CIP 108061 / JCM 11494 / NBRC 100937 / ID131577) TaxID=469383 RepID=D3FEJ1_CONWI|nr:MarR family transcriptional regulator [Conexibacter woesei]ADB49665.1 transcriptional regulator, TrmB [Conexibacter woesei DSM 14684]
MAVAPGSSIPAAVGEHEEFLEAWRHFSRATQRAKGRRCDAGELSLTQAMLLSGLLDGGAMTVGALADRAEVAKPTATRMLDGLERAGYVERRQSGEDRRVVLVTLTDRGDRALQTRWASFREGLERASAALTPRERDEATALLKRLADLLDEV